MPESAPLQTVLLRISTSPVEQPVMLMPWPSGSQIMLLEISTCASVKTLMASAVPTLRVPLMRLLRTFTPLGGPFPTSRATTIPLPPVPEDAATWSTCTHSTVTKSSLMVMASWPLRLTVILTPAPLPDPSKMPR